VVLLCANSQAKTLSNFADTLLLKCCPLILQDNFRELLEQEFVCPKRKGMKLRRCGKREKQWIEEQCKLRYKVLICNDYMCCFARPWILAVFAVSIACSCSLLGCACAASLFVFATGSFHLTSILY
jgi:hypothetical protein